MIGQGGFFRLLSAVGALLGAGLTAFGQVQSGTVGASALPVSRPPAPLGVAVAAADTTTFPLGYATALPSLVFENWEKDYQKYYRFLPSEMKRERVGVSYAPDRITAWHHAISVQPHAQLDTLTRVLSPRQLEGSWESIVSRRILHRDSAVIQEKHIYRSAQQLPGENATLTLALAKGQIAMFGRADITSALQKIGQKKYALVNGRSLLTYEKLKSNGTLYQVGLDKAGHLILHSCTVAERSIKGQYVTYETVLAQNIFRRLP